MIAFVPYSLSLRFFALPYAPLHVLHTLLFRKPTIALRGQQFVVMQQPLGAQEYLFFYVVGGIHRCLFDGAKIEG